MPNIQMNLLLYVVIALSLKHCLCSNKLVECVDEYSVNVTIDSGTICGLYKDKTLLGDRTFYAFKGIPYAQPPINDLRFKAPRKVSPWTNSLKAFDYGAQCAQNDFYIGSIYGDEDCLFLNVFTPNLTLEERLLPVVFYIHGGGFTGGGAKWIEPHILLDEDIVLVTIQYRLGIFGFLSLECPEYSGNMGLKDQLLALQWVNENIIHFGGDKNNVTIYGHSAGATSVNYHLLSPSAQGLFQRAIVTGGSVYNHFALASSPRLQLQFLTNRTAAPVFNATVQHLTANHDKLVSWLKEAKSHDILFHTFKPLFGKEGEEKDHIILWAPIIEQRDAIQPFLLESADDYYSQSNNVDTLFGYSSAEAIFFLADVYRHPNLLERFNREFDIQAPIVGLSTNKSAENYQSYISEIRQFYFNGKEVNASTLNEYTQLISDVYITYAINLAARNQAERSTGKTFFFEFDVVDLSLNIFRARANEAGVRGSAHVEDLPFLFKTEWIPAHVYENLRSDYRAIKIIELVRTFFTNFVKYGSCTVSGQPVNLEVFNRNSQNYVKISNDGLILDVNPHNEVNRFWTQLLKKYKSIFI